MNSFSWWGCGVEGARETLGEIKRAEEGGRESDKHKHRQWNWGQVASFEIHPPIWGKTPHTRLHINSWGTDINRSRQR